MMDNSLAVEIVKKGVLEAFEAEIAPITTVNPVSPPIQFSKYAVKIGKELRENNIPFESLFDLENITKQNDPSDKNIQTILGYYSNFPSEKFLEEILPFEFKQEILEKTLEQLDFKKWVQYYDRTEAILSLLSNFKQIGINAINLNYVITDKIEAYAEQSYLTQPHLVILSRLFIEKGFHFKHDFLDKCFKQYSSNSANIDASDNFSKLRCRNNENKIKYDFMVMNKEISNKNEIKPKTIKI